MRAAVVLVALCCFASKAHAFASAAQGPLMQRRLPALRSNLAGALHRRATRLSLKGGAAFPHPALPRLQPLAWIKSNPVARRMSALRGIAGLRATATTAVDAPVEKFRKDYKPTDYVAKDVDLTFQINDGSTTVVGKVSMELREGVPPSSPLRLDAEDLDLKSVKINGELLAAERYSYPEKDVLEIKGPFPEGEFVLETEVVIKPEENTQLSGLYKSSGMYCTQCEAEGFRRITPMLDRPDAMALYKVRLEGDKKACPILLSNGNLVNSGDLPDGRHFTEWEDPYKKPTYLFAVVAGDLGSVPRCFTTNTVCVCVCVCFPCCVRAHARVLCICMKTSFMCLCMYSNVFIHVRTYVHTYISTHTHTHTHTGRSRTPSRPRAVARWRWRSFPSITTLTSWPGPCSR